MSHAATNWAIRQRGLKPAAKIVLWQLADRHNADTGQCNPKQERLAQDCEMSRSTLNLHLKELERLGLIKRVASVDGATKRQRPTSYVLTGFEREAESENRTRHVSESRTRKPCPKNRESRVRKSDSKNPVREPGRNARTKSVDADASQPAKRDPRRLSPVVVGSEAEKLWRDWLKMRGHPDIEGLAVRSEHAGEQVWLMPVRSPPASADVIPMGIVEKWIRDRKGAHGAIFG